jgi:trehalose synthase-fused probable maltokinase
MPSITEALDAVDPEGLERWVVAQRWFGAKAREVNIEVRHAIPLADNPDLAVVIVAARTHAGTHELYQLLVGIDENGLVLDALGEPDRARRFVEMLRDGVQVERGPDRVSFNWTSELAPLGDRPEVRSLRAEQSNSSVVIDERISLKVYRHIEAGDNPELELLRFLSKHGFTSIPTLAGWYELEGDLLDATLGVAQSWVHGKDGWDLVLDQLATDPDDLVVRLGELGVVIGRMHATLASDATIPEFAPEDPGDEALSLLTATIDEEIERVFLDLPDHPSLAAIAGRGQDIRDRLRLMVQIGNGGRLIRHHGDLHLGQTIMSREGWIVLDFEGEPARPLIERRRKQSPLRDVAGMLRSFAYAASASELLRGNRAPDGWEHEAREAFLVGYREATDMSLMPSGQGAMERLLGVFELEKAVYELRYEIQNRPDWVGIPVAGILRLLDEPFS